MVEFRVEKTAREVSVLKERSGQITLVVPENMTWEEIHPLVRPHLGEGEFSLAESLWCDDEFPRKFDSGEGFITIRAGN